MMFNSVTLETCCKLVREPDLLELVDDIVGYLNSRFSEESMVDTIEVYQGISDYVKEQNTCLEGYSEYIFDSSGTPLNHKPVNQVFNELSIWLSVDDCFGFYFYLNDGSYVKVVLDEYDDSESD